MDHLGIDVRPRGRRLDGRDDRPDDGDRAPRAGALAGLDDVDHRQPLDRAARACKAWRVLLGRLPEGREAAIEQRRQDLQVIGSPGYPMRRAAPARAGGRAPTTAATTPPASLRQMHAITRLRRPHPGPAQARRCRPPSSTATATRWSARPAAAPPPRRSPAPACGCSRAWATTCPASSGRTSSRRSPPTPPGQLARRRSSRPDLPRRPAQLRCG